MHISDKAIEKPRLIIVAAIIACFVGIASMLSMPKERTPRIKLPIIIVAVPNPGAGPEINEKQIIDPIEEEIESNRPQGLKTSGGYVGQAVNGAALMQFQFTDDTDIEKAKRDIESIVNKVKGRFPARAQQDPGPTVKDISFSDFPIIQVFISGGKNAKHRKQVSEKLEEKLAAIDGVSAVDVFGEDEKEVQIELDPRLMALEGFSYQQVSQALRNANLDAPTGNVEGADGINLRTKITSKFQNLNQIRSLPLEVRDGKPITLEDIARVYMGTKPTKSVAMYGIQDAIVLLARAKTDVDIMWAANQAQKVVDDFNKNDPDAKGLTIGTIRSQEREISFMLDELITSALYGTVLVFFLLLVSLGLRNALLIGVSLPFALLTSFALMWIAKKSIAPDLAINNMTLFGMILVIGMVVDGCIIVGENIFRNRELGHSPLKSAKKGINEVGGSLMSAYLTTFAAFGPMFLVSGVMGEFMKLLPVVVIFALCAAAMVDHFLLPTLSVYIMKVSDKRKKEVAIEMEEANYQSLTPEEIEIADAKRSAESTHSRRTYGGMIRFALNHRLLVLGISVLVAYTPIELYRQGYISTEFFPEGDFPALDIYYECPLGTSLEETKKIGEQIKASLASSVRKNEWNKTNENAERALPVLTAGEPGALNTRLDNENASGPEFGQIYVELCHAGKRDRTVFEIMEEIEEKLPQIPGVKIRVKSPKEGPPAGAAVAIRIKSGSSTSIHELAIIAGNIENILKTVPGVFDVSKDYKLRPQVVIEPDRTLAQFWDITTAQIATSVNYALEGVEIIEVDLGYDDKIDVRLRNQTQDRNNVQDLKDLPLRTNKNRIIPLQNVANISRNFATNTIHHYDGQRTITIRCDLKENIMVDDVKQKVLTEDIKLALIRALRPELTDLQRNNIKRFDKIIKSDNVATIEFGGEDEMRDDAMKDLTLAMGVSAILMFLILLFKFNSFIQPMIILFSVPLSIVGVTFGLMACGFNFSVSSMIGLVALSGIVVNDAIVLVDFINRMHKDGIPIKDAVVYAGQLRLRPIFLTTITTIGGLVPLSLNLAGGGEFWQPLTITIMCGLGFATLLQLFVIPLACYTFHFKSKFLDPAENSKMNY